MAINHRRPSPSHARITLTRTRATRGTRVQPGSRKASRATGLGSGRPTIWRASAAAGALLTALVVTVGTVRADVAPTTTTASLLDSSRISERFSRGGERASDDHDHGSKVEQGSKQTLAVNPALWQPQKTDTPQIRSQRKELKRLTRKLPAVLVRYRQAHNAVATAVDSSDAVSSPETIPTTRVLTAATQAKVDLEGRVRQLAGTLRDQTGSKELLSASASIATRNLAEPNPVKFPLPAGSFRDNGNWGHSSGLWSAWHTGNDFSAGCGTPVYAATAGEVSIVTDQGWAGPQLVQISLGTGKMATWYAHMQTVTVSDGQKVKAGQQIGNVGSMGNSTGCHLHFELHPLGGSIYEDSTNPVPWLKATGAYPGYSRDIKALAKLGVSKPPGRIPAWAGSDSAGSSSSSSSGSSYSSTEQGSGSAPSAGSSSSPKPKPKPKPKPTPKPTHTPSPAPSSTPSQTPSTTPSQPPSTSTPAPETSSP